jgi:hypothetical protein
VQPYFGGTFVSLWRDICVGCFKSMLPWGALGGRNLRELSFVQPYFGGTFVSVG